MEKELLKYSRLNVLSSERTFYMIIIVIGVIMNLWVVGMNGGRMPVLSDSDFESSLHFTYQDTREVIGWGLTDWMHIKNIYFSIGDIFISLSLVMILYIEIKIAIVNLKNE